MGHSEHHHHGPSAQADRRYLWGALVLLLAFMAGEVVAALVSGSLALLSDAGHMLTDAGALAGALWAMNLAVRPARGAMTYGWKRAEILAALANGVTLLVVAVVVATEAVRRLVNPPEVTGVTVLVVAVIGIVVNIAATWLIARADRTSLNIRGAYQHVLTDLFGFIGTAVAGVIILATGWTRADPIASLVVVALMLRAGWGLTRDSGRVLLEAAPEELDLDAVRTHILGVEHVTAVHDLHAWTVTSNLPAVSAHLVIEDSCFADGHAHRILDEVQECLQTHFSVGHTTFQVEPSRHEATEHDCF
ncbi:Cadmium, cobalt and zinc/H(+)-K(+) antiporter [Acidipropionibacterium virtanenii]|uniref:Cadmium, cobalt and zinc/H(+)-K(+) antiporter n=2 Tax=Acidipropionibacterium virtanenii TaxID=2057246 RepID=A0A344UQG1_9ACTN|nr:cation diffusion facilitator family transporter [Acidipropionibacterium virtanenii]AXE37509.1 Cadmium, cobalt and zinc/H(+)-K(+) antiporter [Acidipropionibacterium virtanenii]